MGKTLGWMIGLIFVMLMVLGVLFFLRPTLFVQLSGSGAGDSEELISKGEQIYFFGIDQGGDRIPTREGPQWIYELGGSCANCHGPDGRGGFPVTPETKVTVDIRYHILTSQNQGGGGNEAGGYTDRDIGRAVMDGVRPDGSRLDTLMPRWRIGEEDMRSLIAYIKTLR